MENIMDNVELWKPARLSSLITMAKAHYAMSTIDQNDHIYKDYTTDDVRMFLDFSQAIEMANSFSDFSKEFDFTITFNNFIEVLKQTIIGENIIAVVTCNQDNHYICVTTSNVFGLLIKHYSVASKKRAVIYIYCQDCSTSVIGGSTYEAQWTYNVNNFLHENFTISLIHSQKEFIKLNRRNVYETAYLDGDYDSDKDSIFYHLYVNNTLFLVVRHSRFDFDEASKFYEIMENIYLAEYSNRNAEKLYSIFCTRLACFDLLPGDIGEISVCYYDPRTNDYAYSSVDYTQGNLVCIEFPDDEVENGHWFFGADVWEYKNDELFIKSGKTKFEINFRLVLPNNKHLEEKIAGLPNGYLSPGTIDYIFRLATIKYMPKYFP